MDHNDIEARMDYVFKRLMKEDESDILLLFNELAKRVRGTTYANVLIERLGLKEGVDYRVDRPDGKKKDYLFKRHVILEVIMSISDPNLISLKKRLSAKLVEVL